MSKFESLSANIYDEIEAGFLLYILTNPERSQVEVPCHRTAEEKLIGNTHSWLDIMVKDVLNV